MGQNSTEVAYGFGQLGSAYSDLAKPIVPPTSHVICAITSDISPPTISGFTSIEKYPIVLFFCFF